MTSVLAAEIVATTEDDTSSSYVAIAKDSSGPSGMEHLTKIRVGRVKPGDWVKVGFEEKPFLGLVEEDMDQQKGKCKNEYVHVHCLEKPYLVHEIQSLERVNDACKVKLREEKPQLVQDRRGWKYLY